MTLASLGGLGAPAHADQWRDKQWHLEFFKAGQVHKITKGKGVTVAVVDSGVDGNHPDLKGNVVKGTDDAGGDGWRDTEGHGTAMASLIAGHGHGPAGRDGVLGLAPEAKILPVHAPKKNGSTFIENSLRSVADRDVGVINFSVRASGLHDTVREALASDIVVVASAGNTSRGDPRVHPPARQRGVIAVSGIGRNGEFTDESAKGHQVVLSAPAVDITGAWAGKRGKYYTGTGTSGATALVSATAALVRAKFPHLTAGGVINRLIKTADDKGPKGRDDKYGFGVVNPLRALTAEVKDIRENPLLPETSPTPPAPVTPDAKANGSGEDASGILVPALFATGALIALILAVIGSYLILRDRRRDSMTETRPVAHHPASSQRPGRPDVTGPPPGTGPPWPGGSPTAGPPPQTGPPPA